MLLQTCNTVLGPVSQPEVAALKRTVKIRVKLSDPDHGINYFQLSAV